MSEGFKIEKDQPVELVGAEGEASKQEDTKCEEPAELCGTESIELLTEFIIERAEPTAITQIDDIEFSLEVTAEG